MAPAHAGNAAGTAGNSMLVIEVDASVGFTEATLCSFCVGQEACSQPAEPRALPAGRQLDRGIGDACEVAPLHSPVEGVRRAKERHPATRGSFEHHSSPWVRQAGMNGEAKEACAFPPVEAPLDSL